MIKNSKMETDQDITQKNAGYHYQTVQALGQNKSISKGGVLCNLQKRERGRSRSSGAWGRVTWAVTSETGLESREGPDGVREVRLSDARWAR